MTLRLSLSLIFSLWLTACAPQTPPASPTSSAPVRVSTSLPTTSAAAGPAGTPTASPTATATVSPSSAAPAVLPAAATATPLPAVTPTPTPPTPTAAAASGSGPGTVSGSLCYPSAQNPPLTLTLEETASGETVTVDVPLGQQEYELQLPPGEYVAYAHTVGTAVRGSYSKAVPCGLTRDCSDHSLLPFSVPAGGTVTGIDLCDWYRSPGVTPEPADGQSQGVTVTTLQNMDLHPEPSLAQPPVQRLPAAISAPAVGRSADSLWLKIEPPQGDPAWIYAPLTLVQGDPAGLTVLDQEEDFISPADQFVPAPFWSRYPNLMTMHFKGYFLDRAGEPVNGYSLLFYNGTWSVQTHPGGPSRHYPDYEMGEWDLVLTNPTEAAGWWTASVVRYDCPDFETGFNAQCKRFTRLSEPELIKVVFPDSSALEGDWICRYECYTGLAVWPGALK